MVQVPSASDLKARYPEFNGVGDALVTMVIAEVAPMVDDDWEAGDQKPAIMALAAHNLSLEGYPARAAGGSFNPTTTVQQMTSRKVGDVSVTFEQTSSSPGSGSGLASTLGLTVYGRTFARLMKLNVPAIGLV